MGAVWALHLDMRSPNSNFRRNAFWSALVAIEFLASCKKELPQHPQSNWYIDTENFSTNDVEVAVYNNQTFLTADWKANGVTMSYRRASNKLPDTGLYTLDGDGAGYYPNHASFVVQYGSDEFHNPNYYMSEDTTSIVTVSRPDGIFTITLPPTYFRDSKDSQHRVLIRATLRYNESI